MKNRIVILGTGVLLLAILLVKSVGSPYLVFDNDQEKESKDVNLTTIACPDFYTEDISEQDENGNENFQQLLYAGFIPDTFLPIHTFQKKRPPFHIQNIAQVLFETDASPPIHI